MAKEDPLESGLDSIWQDLSGSRCPYCVTTFGAVMFMKFRKTVAEAIRAIESSVSDL